MHRQASRLEIAEWMLLGEPRHENVGMICINVILAAGGTTRYDVPVVMDLLRNRLDAFAERLAADPSLVSARFSQLEFGVTGGRMMRLRGATFCTWLRSIRLSVTRLLVARGADLSVRAKVPDHYEHDGGSSVDASEARYATWLTSILRMSSIP